MKIMLFVFIDQQGNLKDYITSSGIETVHLVTFLTVYLYKLNHAMKYISNPIQSNPINIVVAK